MSPTTPNLHTYLFSDRIRTTLSATPLLLFRAGSTRLTTFKNPWVLTHWDQRIISPAITPWIWTRTRIPSNQQPGPPNHPIEISDGSSFHGSPYRGPDSYQARFAQYEWYFTPSYHSSPHQQQQQQQQQEDPSEDSRFVAVTPPPAPPLQQPPPEPPRRRRSNERMSVRGGVCISTPQPSSGSHYPPLQEEDPQMGGPSNPVSEVNSAPVAPPLGFGNSIPAYAGSAAYNPFEQPAHTNYNYAEVDQYQAAWDYNALHPEGPYGGPWTTGYPPYVYQHPPPPRPLYHQPPQPQLIPPERQQEVLERLDQVKREVQEDRRERQGFFKGLAGLLKGKSKRRDF
ncbi:hypothetical protein HanIR_Chr01g0034011 [Helianthus annuus]|nr:hypothetical protein HanIR_Chr01g0034011 [Helianthus annuus]